MPPLLRRRHRGDRRARRAHRRARFGWTTPRRSAATASSTRWPPSTCTAGPCIIVDFGTATSFDAVSARGEYVGAVTAPGIEISVDALAAAGAQLHKVELIRPRSVIAKNTVEALQAGIIYGFAGQVDGIVERMAAELADDPDDVTGGGHRRPAPLVVGECVDRRARARSHRPCTSRHRLALIGPRAGSTARNQPGTLQRRATPAREGTAPLQSVGCPAPNAAETASWQAPRAALLLRRRPTDGAIAATGGFLYPRTFGMDW